MSTTIDASTLTRIDRDEAWPLAGAVYDQLFEVLGTLRDDQWLAASGCEGWTVRDMTAHLLGAARGHASLPTFLRQFVGASRRKKQFGGQLMDALCDLQIRGEEGKDGPTLLAELREAAPRAVDGRRRTPAPMRAMPIPIDAGGSAAPGLQRSIKNGELQAITLTRDVWIHRFDVTDPLGLDRNVRAAVDGPLVRDVVAEWARRHAQPFTLRLTGPLAATYTSGSDGEEIEIDAIDFVLTLSGRRPMTGLMATPLLF